MKRLLTHRSNRWGYDGWALRVTGARMPLYHTVCTTRAETRELKNELSQQVPDLYNDLELVKIKINLEVVDK